MMRIGFYATLRKIVGRKYIELDLEPGSSLQTVLEGVIAAHDVVRRERLDVDAVLEHVTNAETAAAQRFGHRGRA